MQYLRSKNRALIVSSRFWERVIELATPTSQSHFIESFVAYIESVVVQAAYRDADIVRSIDSSDGKSPARLKAWGSGSALNGQGF